VTLTRAHHQGAPSSAKLRGIHLQLRETLQIVNSVLQIECQYNDNMSDNSSRAPLESRSLPANRDFADFRIGQLEDQLIRAQAQSQSIEAANLQYRNNNAELSEENQRLRGSLASRNQNIPIGLELSVWQAGICSRDAEIARLNNEVQQVQDINRRLTQHLHSANSEVKTAKDTVDCEREIFR
jgi:hypothetical protein